MKRTDQIAKTIASQRHRSKRMRPISDRQSSIHGPAISKAWKMKPGSHRINCHNRATACKMQRINPSTSIIAMAWAMASRNKRRTSRYELTGAGEGCMRLLYIWPGWLRSKALRCMNETGPEQKTHAFCLMQSKAKLWDWMMV